MAYDKGDDKTLHELGEIVLKTTPEGEPSARLIFTIKQYKDQEPKLAIAHKFLGWSDREIETSKMPRLTFEQLNYINKDLPAMLEKAVDILDSPPKKKTKLRKKKKKD